MEMPSGLKFRRRWFPQAADGVWAIPGDPERFELFLLMGQSNMAGYGGIHPDDPWMVGDFDPVAGVLVMGGQGTLRSARPKGWRRWRPAAHPLHLNQNSGGFGPGLVFAGELRGQNAGKTIGLVPCAWGGAEIGSMMPGTAIYRNTVRRAKLAMRRGRLRGVLWHQGESDAGDDAQAEAHGGRLKGLMASLRTELEEPELPFLIGDLAPFLEAKRRAGDPAAAERVAKVRAGLRTVAAEDAWAGFVESEGLTGVDPYHFGRESVVELGRRYAEAWSKFR